MLIENGDKLINTRNWSELVKPEKLMRDGKSNIRYGKFICEPLERGYATTIGNAMRRVLLSSMQGCAIVAASIEGVQHEFTTLPGVLEDMTEVVLNLKQVRIAMTTDEPQRLVLEADKKGQVIAGMIQENQNVRILNTDQLIATLTEDRPLKMELEVRMGKGYVPADMHEGLTEEIGAVILDASYSPVKKVAYSVEQARVGQMTNYDKLILEVWTDGSVTPEDACAYSAKILKDQLSVFINFDELSSETMEEVDSSIDLNPNLFKSIDELELSVRATNCLKAANIQLVGELVQRTEQAMLKTKNFGRKSLDEIRRVLDSMSLKFGMGVEDFDKKYQEWLKRKEKNEA
ncbi:MAG: DNA-directed RNA polymerase subunit alpha [Pseudodesulfovibrio sp.]|uniref:DNA-directed RNA polymerase subunit alpha n=1 Tax=Pseudodesulfovibrio aespoeensis (strain ATCC 700646 / DSM 10631 / Aspo-2) TaxID=643562 RepID=E6VT75_PSEA9|nr:MULTISPECIES: DNA-directed RNA polymerase subunit alpha [Pseudodesulfovibrio]MBU4377944.1 DNA-directed RNA polymerase subunit alpha [Pseudomonadota bacterium]ADU63234.1 DNA-directed RNA polymerase, alpha subunit [Pseudodesulfovibrio aespoeensis Aspo-2]MBU4475131.1 DNA-directed RNA polymerase subunit alpha [Pseudomonadota bacterium]MBU4516195.1 DNA-directed RNA polymerase subunit alpha [Pseudomonadota bacterium]MBU4523566.1 DNA-directed RNA polymerase subunit alpha [Pseudomonadota bacterium]